MNKESQEDTESSEKSNDNNKQFTSPDFGGGMPDFGSEMPEFGGDMTDFDPENMPDDFGDFDPSKMFGENGEKPDFGGGQMPDMNGKGGFGGGFGMGSDDVKLKYTDDDIDSYSNIFNNAKTPVDKADKKRLIEALKKLNEQSNLENTVDVEEVIRYFVVHDFLVNGDSYTGQMIHNYYLYEKNGQFSMIPWDYNLAYGSFMGGNASSSVNSPIDTPVSNGMSDRPMIAWIFDNEEYTEQYHQLFSEFLDSVDFEKLVADTAELIDKYVEKDPTKFCTYDEFKTGVEAISKFCTLRAESVRGQLNGTIPVTSEGQKEDSSALIDTDGLNTSDMGSMGGGMGGFGGQKGGFGRNSSSEKSDSLIKKDKAEINKTANASNLSVKMLSSVQLLASEDNSGRNGRPQKENSGMPDFGGQPPQDFDPGNIPDGFDPGNMPEGFSPFGNTENPSADDTEEEKASESEEAVSSDNGSGAAQGKMPGGELPDMNRFTNMNGAEQRDNTTAYILLGTSALVLLLGLGFALKYKR